MHFTSSCPWMIGLWCPTGRYRIRGGYTVKMSRWNSRGFCPIQGSWSRTKGFPWNSCWFQGTPLELRGGKANMKVRLRVSELLVFTISLLNFIVFLALTTERNQNFITWTIPISHFTKYERSKSWGGAANVPSDFLGKPHKSKGVPWNHTRRPIFKGTPWNLC